MKIDRYYVDDTTDVNSARNIVIRDRISPMGKLTYPTDIAVEVTTGMFKNLQLTRSVADEICKMLNRME